MPMIFATISIENLQAMAPTEIAALEAKSKALLNRFAKVSKEDLNEDCYAPSANLDFMQQQHATHCRTYQGQLGNDISLMAQERMFSISWLMRRFDHQL